MLNILLLILIFKTSSCQRRITNGSRVNDDADTSFVVYIVGARVIDGIPGWLCSGSIIHPMVVLTSASCLSESRIKQMYVIPGYKKYVGTSKIDQDPCTKRMKKKIVSVCKHYKYNTPPSNVHGNFIDAPPLRWIKFDVAIARLDTPIDFFDNDYLKYCSYRPSSIRINFNEKYEAPPAEVVTFGWGHSEYYRPDGDLHDYNEPFLMYASSIILDTRECQKFYTSQNFHYIFDRVPNSMFCTEGEGNYDARGKVVVPALPILSRCGNNLRKSGNESGIEGINSTACSEDSKVNKTNNTMDDIMIRDSTGQHGICQGIDGINGTACFQDSNVNKTNNTMDDVNIRNTRRHGICQNDHGSPAVFWIGGKIYIVGVATAFRVNHQMECKGPYLYTSIKCSSRFINCVLDELKLHKHSRKLGSSCGEVGAVTEDEELDWLDYEDY